MANLMRFLEGELREGQLHDFHLAAGSPRDVPFRRILRLAHWPLSRFAVQCLGYGRTGKV